jgi:hypothetical protein
MTPFVRAQYDPQSIAAIQNDLLAKPAEFFAGMFNGRIPNAAEKMDLVRDSVNRLANSPVYLNDLYTVQIEQMPPFVHLIIRRNDWDTCKDWRHFQQIKNEFVGIENEAVELFPAESRLVDTANVYHLWVHTDARFRFPLGLPSRLVTAQPIGGDRQRPFEAPYMLPTPSVMPALRVA